MVWETMVTPVQPGEFGNFVKKAFGTKFSAIDAKQAFLDTLLADALIVSALLPNDVGAGTGKLPPSGMLEAIVRCAMTKYNRVNVLTTAGKTASLIEGLSARRTSSRGQQVRGDARAAAARPARACAAACGRQVPRAGAAAWLSIWQRMDLSDLPGFPEWDRPAFEQLQANWPTLLSIFIFYSRGYGGDAAGAHGSMTPWGFMQWADDSKVITKIFSDARVQDIYEYTVAAAGTGDMMSFPAFVQAVVRCAVERANPRWRRDEDGRLTTGSVAAYLIQVPDCLGRFLHNCVLRFSPRDPCLAFSQQLMRDEAAKQVVEAREAELMQLLGQVSSVEAQLDDTARVPVDVDALVRVFKERRILGQVLIGGTGGRQVACELTEGQVIQATTDASTFVKGRAGAGFGEGDEAPVQGLSAQEFIELIVRCAQLKYANVPMTTAQRFSAFLRILLNGESPEAAVDAITSRARPAEFDALLSRRRQSGTRRCRRPGLACGSSSTWRSCPAITRARAPSSCYCAPTCCSCRTSSVSTRRTTTLTARSPSSRGTRSCATRAS